MWRIACRVGLIGLLLAVAGTAQDVPAPDAPPAAAPAEQPVPEEAPAEPSVPEPAPAEPDAVPEVPPESPPEPAPMPEVSTLPEEVPVPAAQPEPAPPEAAGPEPGPAQRAFERVFGDAARLDAGMREKVLTEEHGKRHYVDANQDGRPEEVWFVDTAQRHPAAHRPLLVRVIDEDGDLRMGREPDLDSDLYIADWRADGTVDAVLDYTDHDGDNDLDEMALYFAQGPLVEPEGALAAWWAEDAGDDNLLWFDVGYTYEQTLCQYRSHFGGDERFSAFVLAPDAAEWRPAFENPFAFYDPDRDGVTEEAIRIEAEGLAVKTIRHSFDADNDASTDNPRDYDASLTAIAPEGGIACPERSATRIDLRGIPTGPFLDYGSAQRVIEPFVWDRMLLTWDEDDLNTDGTPGGDPQERWEGVIARGTDGFPQVGGPDCGAFNKRYELAVQSGAPVRVYYHPADHRIHLRHAGRAWLDVDADRDQRPDMQYRYLDADGDGAIDTWQVDVDADGAPDDTWTATAPAVDLGWNWPEVCAVQRRVLETEPVALFALTQRLEQALVAGGVDPAGDPVAQVLRSGFDAPAFETALRTKFLSSNETLRFYLDLLKDRLIVSLKQSYDDPAFWAAFSEARGRGDSGAMQAQIEQAFALTDAVPTYGDWIAERRAVVEPGPRVGWVQDWIPGHIAWESEQIAYRCYFGQIDFYGKRVNRLVLPDLAADPAAAAWEWGTDALHVRDTAGCGGVTLYVNGEAFPVRSPEGHGFATVAHGLVEAAPDTVTVEIRAADVGPQGNPYTVRLRCAAFAGRRDSAVEALVEGGQPNDRVELGIGLTRLPQQTLLIDTDAGVLAVRGVQTADVGPIGLGVVFPARRFLRIADSPSDSLVVLALERGTPLAYHIQADWQQGRRFPVAPSSADWLDELRHLAARLQLK